jgi:2-dehydro-3-deoxy-D-gluconate 5-dehydrogenase
MTTGAAPAITPLRELIELTGRTAIVTGGAAGIGFAIARRLHEAGASVVVADLRAADAAVERLRAERPEGEAFAVTADVSDEHDVARVIDRTIEQLGRIDIVVNNAGIYPRARLAELPAELFRHVVAVNLTGVYLVTQAAAARMIEQGEGGRIVNVTSIDALHPSMVGLAHYDASKHGVWGFTKSVALELAPHGIAVNAVAPGGILTPGSGADAMPREALEKFAAGVPMGRMGDPDDIARTALFLASDLASFMTGTQIVVDGGRLLA